MADVTKFLMTDETGQSIAAAINAINPNDAVRYSAQTLTDAQKAQARSNIGAISEDEVDVSTKADKVDGATNGNLAGLDSNGNLTDSDIPASDVTQLKNDLSELSGYGIPEAYQQVDYIESHGSEYIDTGLKPNQNYRIILHKADGEIPSGNWLFGARNSSRNKEFGFFRSGTDGRLAMCYGNDQIYTGSVSLKTYERNKKNNYINGGYIGANADNVFTCDYNLYLFTLNNAGSAVTFANGYKLRGVKIYENDILLRDYVPCYRKADSVAGLYDTVEKTFYTNQGTGTFGVGENTIRTSIKEVNDKLNDLSPLSGAVSNRNLLDNPWFTVNQRGATTITSGYGADRWKGTFNGVTFGDKSCTVLAGGMLVQFFDFDDFTGIVTLSIKLSNGTIQHTTVNYSGHSGTTSFDLGDFTVYLGSYTGWAGGIVLYNNAQSSVTIKAIKLEVGAISTLANDIAPNYGEELRKCQRYFIRKKVNSANAPSDFGFKDSTNLVSMLLNTNVEMRDVPAISFYNIKIGCWNNGSQSSFGTSLLSRKFGTSIQLIFDGISSGSAGSVYSFVSTSNDAYIDISADL